MAKKLAKTVSISIPTPCCAVSGAPINTRYSVGGSSQKKLSAVLPEKKQNGF
jgi:hypothetical protein